MSTDKRSSKILAKTFFVQLRASGYEPMQILDVATELIDKVTLELQSNQAASVEVRPSPN